MGAEAQAAEGGFEQIVEHAKTQSNPESKETKQTNGAKEPNSAKVIDGTNYAAPVDLNAIEDEGLRTAIEARFAHMSRLMKKQGGKYEAQLKEWREIASEQSRKIEEITSNMGRVVDHVQDGAFKTAEDKINAKLMEANANGDTAGFMKANKELVELQARKIAWEEKQKEKPKETKPQPKQQSQEEPRFYSADEALEVAVESGDMSRPEANAFKSWMDERDESNRPVRPWAYTQDPAHPSREYNQALKELRNVFDSPRFENANLAEKLAEIDRRMGLNRTAAGQQVMGGNLTTGRKSNKVTLTPQQEFVATKFKFAGPGKSDAEHLEAYRKQLQKGSK